MKAVDTNVLVRILVDDHKQMEQVKLARQFAKKAGKLFLPQITQVELVWVLVAAYDLKKSQIIHILSHLFENEAFVLQNERQYEAALYEYQRSSADFSDCLIWAESHASSCDELLTFDKKLARLPGVKLCTATVVA